MSTTLENEAVATVENEATQTDWMGDLGGGLGSGPAAGRGRCAAASGRAGSWHRTVDGRAGVGLGQAAEVPAAGGAHVVYAVRALVRQLLKAHPDMPATVIAERVG